ncbi:MAG TPA: hypothetical protein VLK65_31885 [Vicinamibacteria bacterium]|nr:hypothetical protein [Vicinamibacteria bacterium]
MKLSWILATCWAFSPCEIYSQSSGQEDIGSQLRALEAELAAVRAEYEQRLRAIEDRIEALRMGETSESPSPSDEELLREAAEALGAEPAEAPPVQPPSPQPSTGAAGAQTLNPNISVIGDFLGTATHGPVESESALDLREVEFAFQSIIDPFARADFFVTVPSLETVEIEEGYITFLTLPSSFLARAGKMRVPFGRANVDHRPESFAVDRPDVVTAYFGEEGLSEMGVAVSRLIPNPWDLFMELELDVLQGANDVSFGGGTAKDLLYNVHYRTFFDLTSEQSLNLGVSYANGVNRMLDELGESARSQFEGVDFTYQWKPLALGKYRSFLLQTEAIFNQVGGGDARTDTWGLYSFARYQLGRRWFAGARFDLSQMTDLPDQRARSFSALTEFYPSEFQRFRLQYKVTDVNGTEPAAHQLFAQWFYLIGSHGAHKF